MIFLVSLFLILIIIALNYYRISRVRNYDLTKNCLLTRHPILFLSGRRSLFYFLGYWNWIPKYLQDHGYEVFILNLPWRNTQARKVHLKLFLNAARQEGLSFHALGDSSCEPELKFLAKQETPIIKSCSLVRAKSSLKVEDLAPRKDSIQVFEMDSDCSQTGVFRFLWQFIIKIHNIYVNSPNKLDPSLVGVPGLSHSKNSEGFFLNVAIDLAEREFQS